MEKIVRIGAFFSRGEGFASWLVSRITTPFKKALGIKDTPSHTGVVFQFSSGDVYYFESMFGDGWRGPRNFTKLLNWQAKKPLKRWVLIQWFENMTEEEMNSCHQRCMDKVHEWSYAHKQLRQLWKWLRLGGLVSNTPDFVTCSEAVGRVFYPYYDFRKWNGTRYKLDTFDAITPFWAMAIPKVRNGSTVKVIVDED